MKLHVDLETFELIQGPGFRTPVTTLRFKRGDAAKLEVVFLRDGLVPEAIGDPEGLELRFGVKPRHRYDVGYLVHTADWILPAPEAENPTYECSPSFNTAELNAALNLGSATASELPEITLMGEITWREGSAEPTSTRTFHVVVENDVNRGDEGVPASAEPPYPAPSGIELVARKGAPNGYAGLDAGGKVPAAHLAITADAITDATATGRSLVRAASAAAARSAIGAMAVPTLSGGSLFGMVPGGTWAAISQGRRAVLGSPYDYAGHPLPPFFKGLALYVLNPYYASGGYTLADLVAYMESSHTGSFWADVITVGTGDVTVPGVAVVNGHPSATIPIGALSSWPVMTSQPGRQNPGQEVYLDPRGMAVLRFIEPGVVSIHGDLTAAGGGGGSY